MTDTNGSDLVCKAHNGTLSSQERRQLEQLLQSSLDVRLMNLIVGQLDRESVVQPGDDAVVRAIAERTASRRRSPRTWLGRRVARPARSLLAAALVLGLTGAAAAALWSKWRAPSEASAALPVSVERQRSAASSPGLPRATNVQDARSTSSHTARADAVGEGVVGSATASAPGSATPDGRVASPDGVAAASANVEWSRAENANAEWRVAHQHAIPDGRVVTTDVPRSGVDDGVPSVAELFAEANRCRRRSEAERASVLYRRVIQSAPKSREATLARLALAKMEEVAHPKVALQLYRALVSQVSEVRPEALWGTAVVARRLGQRSVESNALETLLHDFPNTAYAKAAQQRLRDAELPNAEP